MRKMLKKTEGSVAFADSEIFSVGVILKKLFNLTQNRESPGIDEDDTLIHTAEMPSSKSIGTRFQSCRPPNS